MKRIVYFVAPEVFDAYVQQRGVSIFDVVVGAFKKELGDDAVKKVEVDKTTLTMEASVDAGNDDIKGFIYGASKLNEKDIYQTNISIFNVSDNKGFDFSFQKLQLKNGNEFTEYVNMVNGLRKTLESTVKGQQHAINEVVSGLLNAKVYDQKQDYPFACFTFLGPEGTGKTLMAHTIASYLEKNAKMPSRTYDRTKYTKEESFIGGLLEFVYANPSCVIVFDDAEEMFANASFVIGEVLNTGKISGVSFSQAILIFTSKIGKGIYSASVTGNLSAVSKKSMEEAMFFDVVTDAVDGRMEYYLVRGLTKGKTVMFNYLDMATLKSIIKNEIKLAFEAFNTKTGISVTYDEDLLANAILYMHKGAYNAKEIQNFIANDFLTNELTDMFAQVNPKTGTPLLCSLKTLSYELSFKNSQAKVKELFAKRTIKALIACDKTSKPFFEKIKLKYVDVIVACSPNEVKKALSSGVDVILLDVLANPRKMDIVPSSFEDYNTQGIDMYEYIMGYFAELPLYIISNEESKISRDRYEVFLAQTTKDIIYFNNDAKAFASILAEIEQAIELRFDVSALIKEETVLGYNAKQIVSSDGKDVKVILGDLTLEHFKRDIDSKYLASFSTIVKFDDVIGHNVAKSILKHYSGFLTKRGAFKDASVQAPKGFLIYGAPGVGKKMLAKAVSGETNATLISHSAYDLVSRTYSSLEAFGNRVQNLFKQAKQSSPCVVLVEDFEAIFLYGQSMLGTFFEELGALNQDKKHPVLFIATTSVPKSAFPREFVDLFERAIGLSRPTKAEREIYIRRHLERKGVTTLSEEAIENFVIRTYGATYSYIKTILDFAIRSTRGQALTDKMLAEAFDLYRTGEENEHSDDDDALRVSYHEIGHYLIDYLNGNHPPFVTIVARGNYGGYTATDAHEGDGNKYTREKMLNEICCCFGGRAAEFVVYGEQGINSGLSSDIVYATTFARMMVCDLGMGKFLYAVEGIGNDNIPKEMLDEIDQILHEQYERAVRLLTENRDKLDILAKALMEKKSLTGNECEKLISKE